MRICHVIESAATGSASVMLSLVEQGVAACDDVTVIYSPVRASPQFLDRARKIVGARLMTLVMHRSPGLRDLRAAVALHRILRRERFDIVHSHSSKAGALARLAGIGCGSAQIYSPHGFVTMSDHSGWIYRVMERVLSGLGDAIVAVSLKEKQHGRSLGIAESKIVVIPNGIDERLIISSSAANPVRDRFTVGFVGRFSHQKNPLLALEAFHHLLQVRPGSRLVMIGDGELDEEVRAGISALGLDADVELPGAGSALPFYPRFDALMCSSRFEGMPLTFLEALAHGLPIVSTDVGGVDELIEAGKTGYICAATAGSLGAGLAAIASLDPADRLSMREQALLRARAFSVRAMFDKTSALYRHCASHSRSNVRSGAYAGDPSR